MIERAPVLSATCRIDCIWIIIYSLFPTFPAQSGARTVLDPVGGGAALVYRPLKSLRSENQKIEEAELYDLPFGKTSEAIPFNLSQLVS
jgi:hypothetical protein